MNILKKILGLPHRPSVFRGYIIDYRCPRQNCYKGHMSYPTYKYCTDLKIFIPQGLVYCPICQALFREMHTLNQHVGPPFI